LDLVITSGYGRLGNRLFLYAHAIGCALDNQTMVFNPCLGEYADFFCATANDPLCRYPAKQSTQSPNKAALRRRSLNRILAGFTRRWAVQRGPLVRVVAENELLEYRLDTPQFRALLRKPGLVLLKGYFFRDYMSLIKHQPLIKQHFKLREPYASNVGDCIKRASVGVDLLVGVHIRRGDYLNWQGGRYYYNDDQYAMKLGEITSLYPEKKIRFLIASDEQIDLKNFAGFDCAMATGNVIEDIYCLAGCDLIVGAFSTYSSWASYVGGVPIYFIHDIDKTINNGDFVTYEQVCIEHMEKNPAFPRN